jgi:hypothetical protein
MSLLRTMYFHAYQNFLMPDRLNEYRDLLRSIAGKGYRFCTVEEFAQNVKAGRRHEAPLCVLRNDVDSDPGGASRMFEIDCAEGARATYYFRLATIDRALIDRILSRGGEVGYHFEELATFAKRSGLTSKAEIDAHLPEMRDEFRRNIVRFREATGVSPRTIALHGDFLNRRLAIRNNYILDRALMDEFGILAETYEPWLAAAVVARLADRPAPVWWHPRGPDETLRDTPAVVYLLVHPRQWVRNAARNAALDVLRGIDEVKYRWRSMRRRRP